MHSRFPTKEPSSCGLSKMRLGVHMSSHVPYSRVWCPLSHVCVPYKWLRFVYLTERYCGEDSSAASLFQAQDVWEQAWEQLDVPGTTEKYQLLFCFTVLSKVLYCRIKNAFLIVFFMYFLEKSIINLWCSVVSDSLWPHGLQPARFLCPWNFPGKNTGVGCHFLFHGICPTQVEQASLASPASAGRFLTTRTTWEAHKLIRVQYCKLIVSAGYLS